MALVLASVAFTQYAVFSWAPYFYIDRIGRRNMVIYSAGSCAVCMAIIAGCLAVDSFATAAAAVAFIFVCNALEKIYIIVLIFHEGLLGCLYYGYFAGHLVVLCRDPAFAYSKQVYRRRRLRPLDI